MLPIACLLFQEGIIEVAEIEISREIHTEWQTEKIL